MYHLSYLAKCTHDHSKKRKEEEEEEEEEEEAFMGQRHVMNSKNTQYMVDPIDHSVRLT